jgi:hypothetical protein
MQMSNPMQAWNAWCALSLQAARLGWEAQGVIALRMMRLATQSAAAISRRSLASGSALKRAVFARTTTVPASYSGMARR